MPSLSFLRRGSSSPLDPRLETQVSGNQAEGPGTSHFPSLLCGLRPGLPSWSGAFVKHMMSGWHQAGPSPPSRGVWIPKRGCLSASVSWEIRVMLELVWAGLCTAPVLTLGKKRGDKAHGIRVLCWCAQCAGLAWLPTQHSHKSHWVPREPIADCSAWALVPETESSSEPGKPAQWRYKAALEKDSPQSNAHLEACPTG